MSNKLFTSLQTQELFGRLGKLTGLQPFALSKLAIALSLRKGGLQEGEHLTDNAGIELNRQTIFGEHEAVFRALITISENRIIDDDEFFPPLVKAHLDRGAKLLNDASRYSKDFFVGLCSLDDII